jgi:hypothetical protein
MEAGLLESNLHSGCRLVELVEWHLDISIILNPKQANSMADIKKVVQRTLTALIEIRIGRLLVIQLERLFYAAVGVSDGLREFCGSVGPFATAPDAVKGLTCEELLCPRGPACAVRRGVYSWPGSSCR